jgi:hypothetical protein
LFDASLRRSTAGWWYFVYGAAAFKEKEPAEAIGEAGARATALAEPRTALCVRGSAQELALQLSGS